MTNRAPRVAEGWEPFGWTLSHPTVVSEGLEGP